jgi:NTP pyrophosphatase (non-canonical NTP hydrolase)
MSQATTTKLYTRDEVIEIVQKAHSRAIRKTLKDYAKELGNEAGVLLLITAVAVKMAGNADRKLEKLLDKAEGKK